MRWLATQQTQLQLLVKPSTFSPAAPVVRKLRYAHNSCSNEAFWLVFESEGNYVLIGHHSPLKATQYLCLIRKWILHSVVDLFIFLQIRQGLARLTTRILGSNTLVQGALPKILQDTPESFFSQTIELLQVVTGVK